MLNTSKPRTAATLLACAMFLCGSQAHAAPASALPRRIIPQRILVPQVKPSQAAIYKQNSLQRMRQSMRRIYRNVHRARQRQQIMVNVAAGSKLIRQTLDRAAADGFVSPAEHRQLMLLDRAIARDMTRHFGSLDRWTFLR